MKKRQYIIDKKFQLGKIFSVIGFVTAIITLVIIFVGVIIGINNGKMTQNNSGITENIINIKKAIDIQQNIIISYSLMPLKTDSRFYRETSGKLTSDYNISMDSLNNAVISNEKMINSNIDIMKKNSLLIGIIIIFTVVGMALLFILMIRHTHRISGPIFIMSRYINEILSRKFPEMRDLRFKDDFKEFYELFRKMAERLIVLEKQEMKILKNSKKTKK